MAEADGVHLGQDEIPPAAARGLLKRPMLLGGSTHSIKELREAIDAAYDYVGLGPAFASPTKPYLKPAGLDYIRQAVNLLDTTTIRPVAIGGITPENLKCKPAWRGVGAVLIIPSPMPRIQKFRSGLNRTQFSTIHPHSTIPCLLKRI